MNIPGRIHDAAHARGIRPTGIFVFVSVLLTVLFIKLDTIQNGVLVVDNLIFYSRASMGGFSQTMPIHTLFYNLTAKVFTSPSHQMLVYLLMLSGTATILFRLLARFFNRVWILVAGILFAFTSYAVVEVVTNVGGSHPLVGLMFGAAGLLVSYHTANESKTLLSRVRFAAVASLLFVAAALASPFFYVFSFAGSLWILGSAINHGLGRPRGWIPAITTLIPATVIIVYLFGGDNVYHYTELEGRTDGSISNMLIQVRAYARTVVLSYVENAPGFWGWTVATGVSAGLIALAVLMNPRHRPDPSEMQDTTGLIVGLSILLTAGGLASVALLVTVSVPLRYVFPSSVLGIVAVFLIADFAFARLGNRARWLAIFIGVSLLGYNFATTLSLHDRIYGDVIQYESALASLIRHERDAWPKGAQVVIASDTFPRMFTDGYNHWSTGFLRIHTGDNTVFGLVGAEAMMAKAGNPFVESHRDHGPEYWKTVERKGKPYSVRRQMVGLVEGGPTFAYRFIASDGTWERIHWIALKEPDLFRIYNARDSGLVLHRSGDSDDYLAELARLGIGATDVFVYGR